MTDVLDIDDLSISTSDGQEIARCARLSAGRGRVIGLVGPSGSGKTTLLRGFTGALPVGCPGPGGRARVLGEEVLALGPERLRQFRRDHVAFVGQDPGSRLNPRMRVGRMLAEAAGRRRFDPRPVLSDVDLPEDVLRRRAVELSGGQQRRVALARALVRQPDLLLLDEPTAGLDAARRRMMRDLLRTRAEESGTTIVLACHDVSLVDKLADDVLHLDLEDGANGTGQQDGLAEQDGSSPSDGSPAANAGNDDRADPSEEKDSAPQQEILRVSGLSAWTAPRRGRAILRDIDLRLASGEALAVVGVSGAGKTTLARAISGLHRSTSGDVRLGDRALPPRAERRGREQRRQVQLVPQDPLGTLNPSRTVGATLRRPLRTHKAVSGGEHAERVSALLEDVGLSRDFADRYPHELSGGQRQRVAIARALAADPDVLVCDEVTSSLDAATAEGIMVLLSELRREHDLALLLITHEMPLVAKHTSNVIVLDEGRMAESGRTRDVLDESQNPATLALNGASELVEQHDG